MAICGFRADNYPFGLLEGEGLSRIIGLLERLRLANSNLDRESGDSALLDALEGAGLVSCNGGRLSLTPHGERFLQGCRGFIPSAPSV